MEPLCHEGEKGKPKLELQAGIEESIGRKKKRNGKGKR
jgi:hypothetical protein